MRKCARLQLKQSYASPIMVRISPLALYDLSNSLRDDTRKDFVGLDTLKNIIALTSDENEDVRQTAIETISSLVSNGADLILYHTTQKSAHIL